MGERGGGLQPVQMAFRAAVGSTGLREEGPGGRPTGPGANRLRELRAAGGSSGRMLVSAQRPAAEALVTSVGIPRVGARVGFGDPHERRGPKQRRETAASANPCAAPCEPERRLSLHAAPAAPALELLPLTLEEVTFSREAARLWLFAAAA